MQLNHLSSILFFGVFCFTSVAARTEETPFDGEQRELFAPPPPAQKPLQVPRRPPSPNSPYQNVFQVHPPVLTPAGPFAASNWRGPQNNDQSGKKHVCAEVLVDHSFGFSYGHPFIGSYLPPNCTFNQVVLNLTVVSKGRQFDRLAALYLGDVELFRTSTAEPSPTGIRWTYHKDVSIYQSLFRQPQKIIFDLGNLIDEKYTAAFNVTLTANFVEDPELSIDAPDTILPISARRSTVDRPSAFNLPTDVAISTVKIPQNVRRAVVTLLANGQANEEFWYTNVLSSDTNAFPGDDDTLLGFSPFREVQLLIDGSLAGVMNPFPVIFTGGFSPWMWRPIVGIDAFDLREGEIDITPWLPMLCEARENGHDFEIRVVGIDDDRGRGHATLTKTVGNYWVVTGKILLWLDEEGSVTTGLRLEYASPEPRIYTRSSKTLENVSSGQKQGLDYTVEVNRRLIISAVVSTSQGPRTVAWDQTTKSSIVGDMTDEGSSQEVTLSTGQIDRSSEGYIGSMDYAAHVNIQAKPNATNGSWMMDGNISTAQKISLEGVLGSSRDSLPSSSDQKEDLRPKSGQGGSRLGTNQHSKFLAQVSASGNLTWISASNDQSMNFESGGIDDVLNRNAEKNKKTPSSWPRPMGYDRYVSSVDGVKREDRERLQLPDRLIGSVDSSGYPVRSTSSDSKPVPEQPPGLKPDEVQGRLPMTANIPVIQASPNPTCSPSMIP
ncbi:MAG: hypothetical protein M1823_000632 [Watsoniomyces obsoletus]|nr:MAG: hypothetical protein M1823_000632 [Watsoniomyces obsoletus]